MLYDKGYTIKEVQKEFDNDIKINRDQIIYCKNFPI